MDQIMQQYDNLLAYQDVIKMRFAELRKSIMPEDVYQKMIDIDAEEETTLQSVLDGLASLKEAAVAQALAEQRTLKGQQSQCVYNPGKRSVKVSDVEALAMMYPGIPEIAGLIRTGDPTASVRSV